MILQELQNSCHYVLFIVLLVVEYFHCMILVL